MGVTALANRAEDKPRDDVFKTTRRIMTSLDTFTVKLSLIAPKQAMEQIINKAKDFVADYMSQYDASHDYRHIERVLGLAQTIQAREQSFQPDIQYRAELVTLGSIMHDVGDRKYLKPGQDGMTMAHNFLRELGANESLATEVQTIINHVSYSNECKNPHDVQQCLRQYPELGIIQDADRLDAIGAVGIARCFAFTAAVGKQSLDEGIVHFEGKLEKLEGMMKTRTGKEIAATRTARLREFKDWWMDEAGTVLK